MFLHQAPEIGHKFTVNGHTLECVGTRDHIRKDGATAVIISWSSTCLQCGSPYETTSTLNVASHTRRCQPCVKKDRYWKSRPSRSKPRRIKVGRMPNNASAPRGISCDTIEP